MIIITDEKIIEQVMKANYWTRVEIDGRIYFRTFQDRVITIGRSL